MKTREWPISSLISTSSLLGTACFQGALAMETLEGCLSEARNRASWAPEEAVRYIERAQGVAPQAGLEATAKSGAASITNELKRASDPRVRRAASNFRTALRDLAKGKGPVLAPKSDKAHTAERQRLERSLEQLEEWCESGKASEVEDATNAIADAAKGAGREDLAACRAGPRMKAVKRKLSGNTKQCVDSALKALREAVGREVRNEEWLRSRNQKATKTLKEVRRRKRDFERMKDVDERAVRKIQKRREQEKKNWLRQISQSRRSSPGPSYSAHEIETESHKNVSGENHTSSSERNHERATPEDFAPDNDDNCDNEDEGGYQKDRKALAMLRRITGYDPSRFAGMDDDVEVAGVSEIEV